MLKKNFGAKQHTLFIVGIVLSITLAMVGRASFAQAPQAPAQPQAPAPGQPSAQVTGPAAESISTTYREPKKDPFLDEEKLKHADPNKKGPAEVAVVPWPSYEEREAQWKQRRDEARKTGNPEPAPSERYLIEELQVMGLYKKPDGQGVFFKPKPTANTMIFATVGQKFYNGSISRIDGPKIEVEEISRLNNGKEKSDKKVIQFTRGK